MYNDNRLKDEINNLKEINANLKAEIRQISEHYGRLEADHNKMKSELYNVTKIKLQNQEEYIKESIEKGMINEKEKYKALEINYNEQILKNKCLDNENNLLNEKLNKLEDEKNQRKSIEDQYNEMTNIILNSTLYNNPEMIKKNINQTINKQKVLEKDYQKLVLEWNKLCDEMENVLTENRYLRKLSNVPENFGLNLEELKLGERLTIENLKGRIRVLQKELEDAEVDRAKAKFKLINTNFSEVSKSDLKRYDRLSPEQKVLVEEYIYSLIMGKNPSSIDSTLNLQEENQNLKLKNEILEKQLFEFKFKLEQKIESLYETNTLSSTKASYCFKKIDLNERFEQLNPKTIEIPNNNTTFQLNEKVSNEETLYNKNAIKENDFEKASLNSSISDNSTHLSIKNSIGSSSIRSNSSIPEKKEKLTIQEKLKLSNGKVYHNSKHKY